MEHFTDGYFYTLKHPGFKKCRYFPPVNLISYDILKGCKCDGLEALCVKPEGQQPEKQHTAHTATLSEIKP